MTKSSRASVRAVLILNVGLVFFVLHDAVSKNLMDDYPLFEVIFIRSLFALPFVYLIASMSAEGVSLRSGRVGGLFVRGLLSVGAFSFFLLGLSKMPLAETFAIFNSSPLLIVALAGPLLGEPATRAQWWAVIVGFAAVLFIIRPGGDIPVLGALAMICSVVCYSLSMLMTRALGRTEPASRMTLYVMLIFVLVSGAITPLSWITPTLPDLGSMALVGLLASGAMYCTISAYKHLAPAIAAPFQYTQIVWAMLMGFLFWGDVPSASLIMAALVVVASGFYVVRAES